MIIADIETICFAKLIKTFEYHLEIVVFFVKRLQFYKKQSFFAMELLQFLTIMRTFAGRSC